MTKWTISGNRARARSHGYDLEARWGNGRDYERMLAERESAAPGGEWPQADEEGIIVRVRSEPKGVDDLRMMRFETEDRAEEVLRHFTEEYTPESMVPRSSNWRDEWNWVAQYRNRARWNRKGNQATAFMGPLTLTVKMTTLQDAARRAEETQGEGEYEIMVAVNQDGELDENSLVFAVEIREDLNVIVSMINRIENEGVADLREYTRTKDPAAVVAQCIADVQQHESGDTSAQADAQADPDDKFMAAQMMMRVAPMNEGGSLVFRNGALADHCEHNENGVCGRCVLLEAHQALGEALEATAAPTEGDTLVVEESLGTGDRRGAAVDPGHQEEPGLSRHVDHSGDQDGASRMRMRPVPELGEMEGWRGIRGIQDVLQSQRGPNENRPAEGQG